MAKWDKFCCIPNYDLTYIYFFTAMIESEQLPLITRAKASISLWLRNQTLDHLVLTLVIAQTTEKGNQENTMRGTWGESDTEGIVEGVAMVVDIEPIKNRIMSETHQNGPSMI